MKSRRRIAFLKAWDHANCIDDYSRDLPLAKWGSGVSLQSSNLKPLMSALGRCCLKSRPLLRALVSDRVFTDFARRVLLFRPFPYRR